MSAYVIAEVVVKDKERCAAEFVPIVSKAPQKMGEASSNRPHTLVGPLTDCLDVARRDISLPGSN